MTKSFLKIQYNLTKINGSHQKDRYIIQKRPVSRGKARESKGKHWNFVGNHRPRPLKSGTESALSELPPDPFFIASLGPVGTGQKRRSNQNKKWRKSESGRKN